MEAYQKSVQDVDVALSRLNATLESYRLGGIAKLTGRDTLGAAAAGSGHNRSAAPASKTVGQKHAPPLLTPEGKLSQPIGNTTESLREREQHNRDETWQEVLDLRYTPLEYGQASPLRKIGKDEFQPALDAIERIQQHYMDEHAYLTPLRLVLSQKYLQIGYPDLAAGEAYKALLLCDAVQDTSDEYHGSAASQLRELIQQIPLVQRISLLKGELLGDRQTAYREPDEDMDVEVDIWVREQYLPWAYRLLTLSLLRCGCYKTAHYYALQATIDKGYRDHWLLDCSVEIWNFVATHLGITRDELVDPDSKYSDRDQWPDMGYVRRELYPWNEWESDRLQELPALNSLMAEVAPKLEIRAVELPALAGSDADATVTQLGVFAREDILPGEVVLDETSMLTANNKLQDALCDACSADLPELSEDGATSAVECPHCQVVFCSRECFEDAEQSYHQAVCGADLDALLRDVPPAEAADALYSLLLLRAIAMAETQDCHPLELNEVKYIWGDFHGIPLARHFQPPSGEWRVLGNAHGGLPRTLPFSFEHNIRLPIQMLEKMDIDPFEEPKYDLWVFNTLYAKFRGTASARLSGLGGRAIRGPEVSAVHPMWCMANHSCDPNVGWEWGGSVKFWAREERVDWNAGDGKRCIKAQAGIQKDEEVLNHYCDINLPVHERREWARGALGGDYMGVSWRKEKQDRINIFYDFEKWALDAQASRRNFLMIPNTEGQQKTEWTYAESYKIVLKYARWLQDVHGVQKNEIVAINITNKPLFIWVWLALWSLGAKPAFINSNLRGNAFVHCVRLSTSRLLLVDPEVRDVLNDETRPELASDGRGRAIDTFILEPSLQNEILAGPTYRAPDTVRSGEKNTDRAILIYTSGTTGLPKAANVSWQKARAGPEVFALALSLTKDDRYFTAMPLYHTSASILGVLQVFGPGCTIVISPKFSPRTYMKQVTETGSTAMQYIGEACRYLVSSSPTPYDRAHKLRIAFGNGMRPDVWQRFKDRFGIPEICEFYGATEGPGSSFVHEASGFTRGAIGRSGKLIRSLFGGNSVLVRHDHNTDMPYRDPKTNLCEKAATGEPGELLNWLDASAINDKYQGYFGNDKASGSKILRDVFKKGDAYYRAGDLQRMDADGRWWFLDRVGDTFRWKSENVSTAEVSQALGEHPALQEANVYGVQLPNHDGRAGCAAIALNSGHKLDTSLRSELAVQARKKLPKYAVPVFLRLMKDELEVTGTMKHQKVALRNTGVEPSKMGSDLLYWLPPGAQAYEEFGEKEWQSIVGGQAKL
ncbi:long-chain fatty acid transporter fat1 [Recurvomyces mirabilis]|uniref:Very long-chain fatty acid transport protein n=1 Tax=Recurvomyces mirabilis TaxID=574656 RepID=A0AAE0WN65_9PEZI|nr:long-chain fatty acid transporter fat1 [Recurvomyces mirabilis]KAK5157764.1 long-chain fatty acid transporter fat1 [Recurvomyces mirabilis]